jgi:hypothetical protein
MKITATEPTRILSHSMLAEVSIQSVLRDRTRRSEIPAWESVFFPDDFKRNHVCQDLEAWRLSENRLEQLAI